MLLELSVKHLAIIDDLKLRLGPGLNVLTGETGAGTSILVGALALALGSRASAETIRHGEDQAEIEAVFDLSGQDGLRSELSEEGLLDDGLLTVRRVVSAAGRNRVFLGGRSLPATRLVEIGERLVSIYGQNESRGLLEPENHLAILDEAGGLLPKKLAYAERFSAVVALRRELADLVRRELDSAARADYLQFVIREIEGAKLAPGEDAALAERRRILASAEKLAAVACDILTACYDSENSVAERVGLLARRAADAARIDPALESLAKSVEEIAIAASEAGRSSQSYLEGLSLDPMELERVESRLEAIRVFSKKYGGSLEAVLRTAEDARGELAGLTGIGSGIQDVKSRLDRAESDLLAFAKDLSAERRKAAGTLSKRVCSELADLGMKGAQFAASFAPPPEDTGIEIGGARLSPGGAERCEFLLSANPGEAPRPLARIASGGELSRIMLAIKNSLAKVFFVPSLVFDEVDAGLGGAQAEIVGRKLKQVAAYHQVLCITHLPQIAGLADRHLAVLKQVRKGRTATTVRELSGEEREHELARMVGGLKVTDAARAAAREMIKTNTK